MNVRVRFAPSPTGNIHIGNIRVAIYNWLFARHTGGKFLLRVEDTDRSRCTPEAVQGLFDALAWLGLDFDEEPLFQSTRTTAHLAAAEQLLTKGLAYREDKGQTGKGECIVFRMPRRDMSFEDEIKGLLSKQAADLPDFVIVRSDGTPVFHLANVVDDIAMGITHVIRGDDHVENTFRHIALFEALGAPPARYAHLPMIVNAQGKPYSKRDGAAFVGEFRERGFLPEALFNYLALLGWSPGNDREIMSREEMIALFDLKRVKAHPAMMDMGKCEWMNGEYIRRLPQAQYSEGLRRVLKEGGLWHDGISEEYLAKVAALMQVRTKTYRDLLTAAAFFFTEDYPYDAKAVKKRLQKEGARQLLALMRERMASLAVFDEKATEATIRTLALETGRSAGELVHPLRVAVTGLAEGPGLFETLAVLGKDRVLKRLDRALERFRDSASAPAAPSEAC